VGVAQRLNHALPILIREYEIGTNSAMPACLVKKRSCIFYNQLMINMLRCIYLDKQVPAGWESRSKPRVGPEYAEEIK